MSKKVKKSGSNPKHEVSISDEIVVKSTAQPRRHVRTIVITLVVIGIVAAPVAIWLYSRSTDTTAYDDVNTQTQTYAAQQQYDLAIAAWEKYLKRLPPRSHDFEAYVQIGTYKHMQRDLDGALASYLKAEEISPDRTSQLEAIASIYEQKGDKAKALQYYKKLRDNFPADHSFRAEEIKWLDKKITSLEMTQGS